MAVISGLWRNTSGLEGFVKLEGEEDLFSGFAGLTEDGGFGRELLVPFLGHGRLMQGARVYITSAYGLRINYFDDLVSQTADFDVCCLTAFSGSVWRYVFENPNRVLNETDGNEKYLREHKAQAQRWYELTDKLLWKDLNRSDYGVLSLDGVYRLAGAGYESNEKAFMVVNTERIPTQCFFRDMVELGNDYGQMCILFKTAQPFNYQEQELEPGIGYWINLDASDNAGQWNKQEQLSKVNIEKYLQHNKENFGHSLFHSGQGFKDREVNFRYFITGVDFSNFVVCDYRYVISGFNAPKQFWRPCASSVQGEFSFSPFKKGDNVIGKTWRVEGLIGTVLNVRDTGSQFVYDVQFGEAGSYSLTHHEVKSV